MSTYRNPKTTINNVYLNQKKDKEMINFPYNPIFPNTNGSWYCGICNQWIAQGIFHTHNYAQPQFTTIYVYDPVLLKHLENIDKAIHSTSLEEKCLLCGKETKQISFRFGYGSDFDGEYVCWSCAARLDGRIKELMDDSPKSV